MVGTHIGDVVKKPRSRREPCPDEDEKEIVVTTDGDAE